MLRLVLLVALALLPALDARSAPIPAAKVTKAALASDLEHLLSVEIESSRPQLVAGEGLGVIARIKNISKLPVYLKEDALALTVPLEMEGSRSTVSGYASFFPTEPHLPETNPTAEDFHKRIKLSPGDTYSVFWTNTFGYSDSSMQFILQQVSSQFQFIFFTPGRYSITLNAKYWTDPALPPDSYRTLTQNIVMPVVSPLFVILFGAAVGGCIAHFVLPQTVPSRTRGARFLLVRISRRLLALLGSALLSVIVTILLSRVSESNFLISVTVNDFWGAIVTGFVANYAGYKILEKLLPSGTPPQRAPAKTDTA